jgi:hypothetical protein
MMSISAEITPTQQQPRQKQKQHDLAFILNIERSAHVPSLPLELWNLVFWENTDPHHLWIVGRQVCATWRAEIPKVIAKKYLENRRMTNIDSCCPWNVRSVACLMGRKLVFSHYKGKDRIVFGKSVRLDRRERRDEKYHSEGCTEHLARMKEARSQNVNDFHDPNPTPCLECTDKAGGKRCDLPTYYIRIKTEYLDTELCGLEVDFEKGEISVDWKAMLTAFYREAAVLKRHGDQIATKAIQWYREEKRSLASVVQRALEDRTALWNYRKKVRDERVESWHRCNRRTEDSGGLDRRVDYKEEWADPDLRIYCDRYRFYHWSNAEDRDEKQTWEYRERLDGIGRILLNSGRYGIWYHSFYEKDGHGESSLRKLLFTRAGWLSMTPEEKEDLEARCVMQWLGMGRVQSLLATTV